MCETDDGSMDERGGPNEGGTMRLRCKGGTDDSSNCRTVRHGDISPPYKSRECLMHV